MSADADTHTAATAYGEVEIEVVECASCGAEVAKGDAEPFTIGEDPIVREGWACEHCADDGPAAFPTTDPIPFPVLAGCAPVAFVLGTLHMLQPNTGALPPTPRWYLAGMYGALLTGALFGAIWLLFSGALPAGEVPL
jgi:hypothetical protein